MNRTIVDRLVSYIGAVMGVALLVASGLLFFAHGYVHGQVTDQLREQQITFPAAGTKAITSLPTADQTEISQVRRPGAGERRPGQGLRRPLHQRPPRRGRRAARPTRR